MGRMTGMGHTDGTDLVYGSTDRREIDTFDYNGYKPQKGKSIAHKWIATEKAVYVSLDIQTGGENCGIIQRSAQIFRSDTAVERWEYQKCQAFEATICTTGMCVPNVCSTY